MPALHQIDRTGGALGLLLRDKLNPFCFQPASIGASTVCIYLNTVLEVDPVYQIAVDGVQPQQADAERMLETFGSWKAAAM